MRWTKRRVSGYVMFAIMANATFSPPLAYAAKAAIAVRAEARDGVEAVEIYDATGNVQFSAKGTRILGRIALRSPRLATSRQRQEADSMLKALVAARAKAKAKGSKFVGERLIHVMGALAATTDSAYRAEMDRIPVKIVKTAVTSRSGQAGTRTTYWLQGRPYLSTVQISAKASKNSEIPSERPSGPTAAEGKLPDCTYYDAEDDYTYSGECATQQDLDDAAASFAATQADAAAVQSMVNSAVASNSEAFCEHGYHLDEDYSQCVENWGETSPSPTAELERSHAKALQLSPRVESIAAESTHARPSGPSDVAVVQSNAPASCLTHALAFGASAFAYLGSCAKMGSILAAADPPLAAVLGGMFAVAGTACIMVAAGIALNDCVAQT